MNTDPFENHQLIPQISVIIPTLNESHVIRNTFESIQNISGIEILVVDGGSVDDTVHIAQTYNVQIFHSPPGRACQMNKGASVANGQILVFLHADTLLPKGFEQHIRSLVSRPKFVAGAFQLRIDSASYSLRIIEKVANWRSRHLQMPYGDQAIFIEKKRFLDMGGFPNLPIMEDFEFIRQLRSQGQIVIAPVAVITSERRWKRLGILRTTLINQIMILAFHIGIDPLRLALWYRKHEK